MAKGIRFDEVMKGGFYMGESDPRRGVERGDADGTTLAMNASVVIDDLERFIDDPRHLGGLGGSIDFPPLGQGLAASSGVFNLFSPTDDPALKLMVYEMAIEADGRPLYVAGRKEVRDGPGFDLWSDTTTLYTCLHEGHDSTGPVLGAGVLRLGVPELTDLLSTLRVTGTDSAAEKTATVARFGSFFMGELWDTYGAEALRSP